MSVLHNAGRALRAQTLVGSNLYFVFSSDTSAESASLDFTSSTIKAAILGGVKSSRQLLIRLPLSGETPNVTVNGTGYVSVDPGNLVNLTSQGVNYVYCECVLNDSVVADTLNINSIYVFSDINGLVPSNKSVLTNSDLTAIQTTFVAQSQTLLAGAITMNNTVNKVIQMILEM